MPERAPALRPARGALGSELVAALTAGGQAMTNPRPGETYVARLTIRCRCGATVEVDTVGCAVFHPLPTCDAFTTIADPARYLRWVRTGKMGGELGDGS